MLAESKVKDVLIAYPLIGPNQKKFIQLTASYPETKFSTLIDHEDQIAQWKLFKGSTIHVFIDLDAGMHRTGLAPEKVAGLIKGLDNQFNLRGFHIYDGHIHDRDPEKRKTAVNGYYKTVNQLIASLELPGIEVICGSSITFPIHAQDPDRQLSPGTTLLWDFGYASKFPDLEFEYAAIL
ncbi:unnamed protein product, partial [Chrysoparadoxa australica]